MKSKTVTLLSRRKAMTKDPSQIFLWNSNAIVNDGDHKRSRFARQGQALSEPGASRDIIPS
jgi:hypothetical protein